MNLVKCKSFAQQRNHQKKTKRQPTWEKIFANEMIDKE